MTVIVPLIPEPVPLSTNASDFDARADAHVAALPEVVRKQNEQNVENNTISVSVNAAATAASLSATTATAQASIASTQASNTLALANSSSASADASQASRLAAEAARNAAQAAQAAAAASQTAAATSEAAAEVAVAASLTNAQVAGEHRVVAGGFADTAEQASLTAVEVVAAASAAIEGVANVEANVLTSKANSDAAQAAMLTAISYLAAAQELLSVPSTNLAINILGSAVMKSGSVFYSVEHGVPSAYVTYTEGVSQWNVAATDSATGITTVTAARQLASPLRAKGRVRIQGSGGADTVFIEPGSSVSFISSGLGVDTVYLPGSFSDYLITHSGGTGYKARRTLVSGEVEAVDVVVSTSTSGGDRLVFKDGYIQLDRTFVQPSGTALYNGTTYRQMVATDLNTSVVTPATFPANAILVDTNSPTDVFVCNGAAVSRTDYPALFARIGTRFGVGDGATTFNLPTIPSLATGVSAYIKA